MVTVRSAEGVLLDFDGTLTRPILDWETMKTEMRLEDGTKILEYLKTAPPHRAREVAEILERHEIDAAHRAEVNSGTHELLAYLGERGIPFGVVTNNAWRHVAVMMDRMKLAIEKVVTRDVGIWKPDPRHVLMGAKAIGTAPERCIFIGDGMLDMMAARGAGMTAVHLAGTNRNGQQPDCDHQVSHLREALDLIRQLIP